MEDIYVNRRLYKHRPGTEKSNLVRTIKVFNEGFTTGDGTLIKWSEQPEAMQAIMGVYLLGCRLPHLIENLSDEVQVVRNDQVLIGEMEAVPDSGTPYDRAEIAFRVLARLRELGFCIPPSQQPQEEEPSPVPQPQGQQEEDEDQKPSPGGGGSQGQGQSDEDEDAEEQDDSGQESEDSEESEDDDAEPSSGSEAGDDESYEEGDDKAESDDADGEESDDSDDDSEDEDQESSGGGEEGDDDDEAQESDGDDDQDLPSGSGDDTDAEGESSDEGDDDPQEEGPTPEELDRKEAEDIAKAMKQLMGHDDDDDDLSPRQDPQDDFRPAPQPQDNAHAAKDLDDAIRWEKFDAPPSGIKDFYEKEPEMAKSQYKYVDPIEVDPGLISGETARMRAVFALNRKTAMTRSLKGGPRLDVPHLHRIGQDDFRIFAKKDIPRKRDWFVLVGLDDSGSTHTNGAAPFIRTMAVSVGNMLNGAGVKFAMYGHGGTGKEYSDPANGDWSVRHLIIKGPDEPWTEECKSRANALGRDNTCNFDGHTLEQYRKVLQTRRETDKMLLYFTDGEMPMMNYDEEKEVLEREITILRQLRVNLFGVGYRTTSPKKYGMDTIEVQDDRDLPALTHGLAARLGR